MKKYFSILKDIFINLAARSSWPNIGSLDMCDFAIKTKIVDNLSSCDFAVENSSSINERSSNTSEDDNEVSEALWWFK